MHMIDLRQGSPEWLAWRETRATASDAAVIMGAAPSYWAARTWDDLRLRDAGLADDPDDRTRAAWQHGSNTEPAARDRLAPGWEPVCVESADGLFGASLDGWSEAEGAWCELKCPVSGRRSTMLRRVRGGGAPPHVWWQMVHQAGVIESAGGKAGYCRLGVYVDDDEHAHLDVPAADLLADWPRLEAEWRRYLDGGEQLSAARALAARRYLDAHREAESAKAALAEAKAALIEHGASSADGVTVYEIAGRERTDWRAVAEELGADSELVGRHTTTSAPALGVRVRR